MTIANSKFRTPPRTKGRAALAAAVILGGAFFADPSASAGSTPYTDSEAIAVEAVLAVDSFDTWNGSGDAADLGRFERARDKVATMTAREMGLSISAVRQQFSSTTMAKQRIILAAMTQLGVPYRSMQSREGEGFDCSGLTTFAFNAMGLEIPRSSGDQYRAADERSADEAQAGDLLYYPGHVGIYLGGDIYVHSRQTGRNVEVTMVPSRSHDFADIVPTVVIRLADTVGKLVGDSPGAPMSTQTSIAATPNAR